MKLIKFYIENFGKLHQYKCEFTDGLNVIKKDNGFGKTTIAVFIKSMFYGLDTSVKSESSDRKVYKPWQGGTFGGNLEFEINQKRYKIERFFGNKPSDDTFKLYDLSTGLESDDFSKNIGEEIFKINKDAYERSTYIPQSKIVTKMEDSISAKLGNVLESENDINTSENAINMLKEAMKFYIKTGKKGVLNEKKEHLSKLQREMENTKFDEENLAEREKKLEEIEKCIKQNQESIKNNQKRLTQKIEKERISAKKETYKNILENLYKNQEIYKQLNEFFKNGIPEDKELDDISLKYTELEKAKLEIDNNCLTQSERLALNSFEDKFKNLSEQDIDEKIIDCTKIQEINNEIQSENSAKEKLNVKIQNENGKMKSKGMIIGLLIFGIIILVVGILLIALKIQVAVGVLAIVCGAISEVLAFIKNKSNIKKYGNLRDDLKNIQEKINQLENDKNELNNKINIFIKTYSTNLNNENNIIALSNLKTEYAKYKELLNKNTNREKSNELTNLKRNQLENEIKVFINKYLPGSDKAFLQMLQDIKLNKSRLLSVKEELERTEKMKDDYEKLNSAQIYNEKDETDNIDKEESNTSDNIEKSEEELSKEIKELTLKVDELMDMKNQLKNQIEVLENKIDENEYLQNDIQSLSEEIKENESRYSILEKTKTLLETAKENFSSIYLKDMIDGFNKYLRLLDNSQFETDVDINLDVKIEVNGSKREIRNFSAGYQDLIYICMRFSLINALFKDESPFVVLDDPFVNLDDDKTRKALSLLDNLAKEYQIIYFVCNQSRT